MYFKKLELIGFKSFCDKTTIHFESGVTAVVGPNGCGKSNISDSIRWVLGEQSAKSLRGSSMEDVIFNGSSIKEPLNLAEVSLTLSNESRILPIDYEEVTITRRLYRSGESEYLINKNTVRLRDVHELLMGTGIGTESYSIIEQGKMDLILNSKADERREIFEEAAGITKFKSKKKEALRKLEQTDNNLTRINDIIVEVKRQIGSIERQAKKAESYKQEFEKLKNLELAMASREFLLFENKKKSQEEGLGSLKMQEEEFLLQVKAVEQKYAEAKHQLDRLDQGLRETQSREFSINSEIRRSQDRTHLNSERIGELGARRGQVLNQIEISKRRLEEFSAEWSRLNQEFEALQSEERTSLQFLGSVETDFAAFESRINEAMDEERALKADLFECANKKAHSKNDAVKINAQAASLAMRLRRLRQEEEALLKDIREINETLDPPLFHNHQDESQGLRFDLKIKEFKSKLISLLQAMLGRRSEHLSAEDEAQLDSEIKSFAEEAVKIQGQVTVQQSRAQHLEEAKKKLEEKLVVISAEIRDLLNEECVLLEREKALGVEEEVIVEEEAALNRRLLEAQELVKTRAKDKESHLVRLVETRSSQSHCTAKREKAEKDKNWIQESKTNETIQLDLFQKELEEAVLKVQTLQSENKALEGELVNLNHSRDEVLKGIHEISQNRVAFSVDLESLQKEKDGKEEVLREMREKVHAFELENTEVRFEIDRLKERMFNAYQVDLLQAPPPEGAEDFNLEEAKRDIQLQRDKLSKIGPVNLVAIQEHDEMKERFDFLIKQQQDLVQAKDDLHKAILKINRTTKELFIDTFQQIQKHFTEYYKLLFGGGNAELVLLDENDVLESGIEIVARPPGKKLQNISLLSGGEKALTAIALLFALFKVKPSPFCVLDEIDAPLDESNVDRFCNVLKDFIAESQFILITHNKRTMNLADAMYGITMAENGVSKIVSVRFSGKAATNGNGRPEKKEEALV